MKKLYLIPRFWLVLVLIGVITYGVDRIIFSDKGLVEREITKLEIERLKSETKAKEKQILNKSDKLNSILKKDTFVIESLSREFGYKNPGDQIISFKNDYQKINDFPANEKIGANTNHWVLEILGIWYIRILTVFSLFTILVLTSYLLLIKPILFPINKSEGNINEYSKTQFQGLPLAK